MKDVDFLSAEFHQRCVRRKKAPWQIVVVAVFAMVLAVSAISQQWRRGQLRGELARLQPRYDQAAAQNTALATAHAEMLAAREIAELYAYLGHPWPRTQILKALTDPLPDAITLEEVQIALDEPGSRSAMSEHDRADEQSSDEELVKLSAARRDLITLRERDRCELAVTLVGVSCDGGAVYQYVGEIGRHRLFGEAELLDIEALSSTQSASNVRFQVRLVVRPAYGQPGGPTEVITAMRGSSSRSARPTWLVPKSSPDAVSGKPEGLARWRSDDETNKK